MRLAGFPTPNGGACEVRRRECTVRCCSVYETGGKHSRLSKPVTIPPVHSVSLLWEFVLGWDGRGMDRNGTIVYELLMTNQTLQVRSCGSTA